MLLGFAGRLQHVFDDAAAIGGQARVVDLADGKAADQGLVEQVLVVARGRRLLFQRAPLAAVDAAPAPHRQPPHRRQFGDDVEPRADVLRALGVVGRRGEHRVRPALRAVATGAVERVDRDAEYVGFAADFVQRDQPLVTVIGGVLDALGRHRRRVLLQSLRERAVAAQQLGRRARRQIAEQHAADEVEHARVGGTTTSPRAADRPVDVTAVLRARLLDHVGAVDGEAGDDFGQCQAQRVQREITRPAIGARQPQQRVGQHGELAGQARGHDDAPAAVGELLEILGLVADEGAPGAVDPRPGARVDEQAVDDVGEAVAGRAVQRPVRRQLLVRGSDLLGQDVEGPGTGVAAGCRARLADQLCVALLQPAEIGSRVEQAVGMVDAQAVDLAAGDQIEHQPVRRVEDLGTLHPQCGQFVDVEEAAVVDLVGGDAPVGQPVRLLLDQ